MANRSLFFFTLPCYDPRGGTVLFLFLFVISSLAAAICPEDGVTVHAFNATLEDATEAFTDLDRDSVNMHTVAAYGMLPCLAETITPAHAAKFHRTAALQAFLARETELALDELQASLRIEQDYALPPSLGRPGSPLHNLFEEARRRSPSATEPVGSAPGEATLVDGRKSTERPTEIPTILQRIGEGWVVAETKYLLSNEPLPEWAKPRAIELEATTTVQRKPPSPTPFFVAGSALAAASLVASGLGITWSKEFDDPATPYDELEGLRDRANKAATVSAITGATAFGFGGTGLYVVIRW